MSPRSPEAEALVREKRWSGLLGIFLLAAFGVGIFMANKADRLALIILELQRHQCYTIEWEYRACEPHCKRPVE